MARTRRAPLRTDAEITRDAIAELQAQMANITTALQALNIQRPPPPPPRENVECDNDEEDDEDDDGYELKIRPEPLAATPGVDTGVDERKSALRVKREEPRKPAALKLGLLERLAAWMLSVTRFMVPSTERPVRGAKVAELLDVALQIAPPGVHVAAPEVVWAASQGHTRAVAERWLLGTQGEGSDPMPAKDAWKAV